MSDVPRSLQRWVSTIHTVVLTADVFQLFIKNNFLSSGIFLVPLTYPFLSRTSKHFVLEVYISGMGVRVEWFVSIITSSKYNGEKKDEWTRRFVPPNERRKLEPFGKFVPLVESVICLLVDVATLSTIYDVRHPLLLPPGYPTLRLPFQLLPV